MKEIELLAQMCSQVNSLLNQLYLSGDISRETFIEHTKLKNLFLQNLDSISSGKKENGFNASAPQK